jgi:hypothetical protein
MRLLEILPTGGFQLTGNLLDDAVPRYAILSHTWGEKSQEVTFEDIVEGLGRNKAGYRKIEFCGKQAARDGLQYFWVDSCCINKSSDAELSESLNLMYRWYHRAEKCYVYLSDVSTRKGRDNTKNSVEQAFRKSRWFTRGWTLQELIAPPSVEFFSSEGQRIGDKSSLVQQIHNITGISSKALHGASLSLFSIDERLAWAEKRRTTRKEDKAYCLLGIFNVFLRPIYGEGDNAFKRLKAEIDKSSKGKAFYLSITIIIIIHTHNLLLKPSTN